MPLTFSRIGILARNNDARVEQTLRPLIAHLLLRGAQVFVEDELRLEVAQTTSCSRTDIGRQCDLVVAVGGDGTLLAASRAVAETQTPLLGVNLGRLGFLTDVLPEDMRAALDHILAGEFIKKLRLRLSAHIVRANGDDDGENFHALNECVIRNQEFARILDFDTYMNDSFISHHRADGIVVATPTGSTAYALSGGGPVVHPELPALALVPICPHMLSDRPLLVAANQRLEVRISAAPDSIALFTADGQLTRALAPGDRVLIERAQHDLILIHPPDYDYFHILRHKLGWGREQDTSRSG
ncbi:MAG TPA: NAD(+) kinase [Salinisphaeraceae bacterium]|nr:NAD(+) kinase [Salinisphaeraceae bacterium]